MLRQLHRPFLVRCAFARTYLSSAYNCAEAWEKRLSSPLLEKLNIDSFYVDVEQKYQQQKKTSAIDVDIYVNKVSDENHVDEMADLLHKLRLSGEASNILDSSSHAFVRNLVQFDQIPLLITVLRDPLNYGVFLDTFTANLALDKLIEAKDFFSAAQIATFLMLQEDFGNEITKSMCIYSCIKYLANPEPFIKEEKVEDKPVEKAAPVPKSKKGKKEENRVRVKFLRNEYFDDHFDLKESRHLVGKTLLALSRECPDKMRKTLELLGLSLFEKFNQAIEVSNAFDKKTEIYQDILQLNIKLLTEHPNESESYKSLLDSLNSVGDKVTLISQSLEEETLNWIKASVEKCSTSDIAEQKKIYDSWIALRTEKLNDEILRLKRATALKEMEQATKDMAMEEKKLWFFENEEQIDLEIEGKIVRYPKRWFGKKKKPRVVDEGYIPPEIRQSRN